MSRIPAHSSDLPGPGDLLSDAVFNGDNPLLMRQLSNVTGAGAIGDRMERWYNFVRDAIRYDPFAISLDPADIAASRTLENQYGHCVHKSVLLVAGFRAMGIPTRLGLARVRNHLATESLEAKLGTDVLTPHGYVGFWNGDRWVKCTPVFNQELCHRLGTDPLQWDDEQDVLFQPLSRGGDRFMEYLEDYGLFAELPIEFIHRQLKGAYPHAFDAQGRWSLGTA